jgi:hypothetical protein
MDFRSLFGKPDLGVSLDERRLPNSRWEPSSLQISYQDGRGVLREALARCTCSEFAVSKVQVERDLRGRRRACARPRRFESERGR